MKCPRCSTESSGRFCPECGTPLSGAPCGTCGAELPAGARFCTACGDPARAAGSGGAIGWSALGILAALFLVIFVLPALKPAPRPLAGTGMQAPAAALNTTSSPPPLTGTPREQADRLYNRVMETYAAGDSANASFFLPMAIEAYRLAAPLDADGYFHLSMLELAAGDPASARRSAERILDQAPSHLFGLAAAAQAARSLGDTAAARDFYQRFLTSYDAEVGRELREYVEHAPMLPAFREEARSWLTPQN